MDDCLVSLPSVEEAIATYKNLSELLAKRGFRLQKWLSNNDKVLQEIPESERSSSAQGHTLEDSTKERLLGMLWKLKEDAFTFSVNLPEKPLTCRGILSALSSLYDPLGFVSPVILEGRLLLQAFVDARLIGTKKLPLQRHKNGLSGFIVYQQSVIYLFRAA